MKAYPHVMDHAYAKEKLMPKSESSKRHETRENYTISAQYDPKSQLYLLLNPTSIREIY